MRRGLDRPDSDLLLKAIMLVCVSILGACLRSGGECFYAECDADRPPRSSSGSTGVAMLSG